MYSAKAGRRTSYSSFEALDNGRKRSSHNKKSDIDSAYEDSQELSIPKGMVGVLNPDLGAGSSHGAGNHAKLSNDTLRMHHKNSSTTNNTNASNEFSKTSGGGNEINNNNNINRISNLLEPVMNLSDHDNYNNNNNNNNNNYYNDVDSKSEHSNVTSHDGASSGDDLSNTNKRDSSIMEIAQQENKWVIYSRALVMIVLFLSAGIVGAMTWIFVSNEELQDYRSQFGNDVKEIIDVSDQNAANTFGVLQIFSILLSSSAKQDNATWPLYTLPDFEQFGYGARQLSGALLLAFTPLVTNTSRNEWEQYSINNQQWIDEGLHILGYDDTTIKSKRRNITNFIYRKTTRSFVPEYNFDIYSPIWQLSPAPIDTSVINFNLFNHPTFKRLVNFVIYTRQPAISEVLDTQLVFGTSAPQKGNHPQSILVLPVFEDSANIESTIIGHVIAVIPWGQFFEGILQDEHNGVYAVLRESCGQVFTYQINGPNATFLGPGDHHESSYDDMVESTKFVAYQGDLTGISFTDDDADNINNNGNGNDHCEYTLDVYPSSAYQAKFESSRPLIFTLGVISVFAFTSFVFVIFDCFVRRRQLKVNSVAVRSNAIVTSLFPAQVRDKLYEEKKNESTTTKKNNNANIFKRTGGTVVGGEYDKYSKEALVPLVGGSGGIGSNETGDGDIDDDILGNNKGAPIADLFPSATVLFMDIAGFTAWSSAREPSQVFVLLETIYSTFDKVAKKRHVFKVETIGDCYVAVCGLPEPCEDHAVVMARFARDCLIKMAELTRKLESTLGPDTGDLAMRVGMHSGPVTAGVLRGDRARFQLFGDTVNTAARMESNGIKTKIQISQETAELIIASGKAHWITPRDEKIVAKGKGELQTYWLLPKSETNKLLGTTSTYAASDDGGASEADHVDAMDWIESLTKNNGIYTDDDQDSQNDTSDNDDDIENSNIIHNERTQRLIDYNCDILLQILKKIVLKRERRKLPSTSSSSSSSEKNNNNNNNKLFGGSLHGGGSGSGSKEVKGSSSTKDINKTLERLEGRLGKSGPCLNEFVEIINLPEFDAAAYDDETTNNNYSESIISSKVATQLCNYVKIIASMYRENPFHNFDHASHVTQSTSKLLSRIVAMKHIEEVEKMHDHTYGITSDPLTQFAVVFSSLIHDVDHRGVPNFLLVKEDPALGALYSNQAVAEQNSVDVAWNLLMDTQFTELRRTIYSNECEMKRFRQLVVNSIMATDIFDKELAALRRKRWETAFHQEDIDDIDLVSDDDNDEFGEETNNNKIDDHQSSINRKATIVIEHIIQASDVAHTMQHWHIYTKFNERLYHEMYLAYTQGRSDKDPTKGWYDGELWFFDNYVIPLAKKLKECGVFGVSGDEYLNYAQANRNEWERKGKEIVESNHRRYLKAHKRGSNANGQPSGHFEMGDSIMPVPEK